MGSLTKIHSDGYINYYLKKLQSGPVRESNPGPLAPLARIMPLDQQANDGYTLFNKVFHLSLFVELSCGIIGQDN